VRGEEYKGHGFILRIIQAQEADVIVRILTTQGEKISAFAKAGLKSRKRFGGALEPLTQVDFLAIKKENQDLYYLQETQMRYEFKKLRLDFERLTAATYLSELAELGAQEGLETPEIYNLLGAAWKALEGGYSIAGVTRQYEIKLLSILGWLPGFLECAQCQKSGVPLSLQSDLGLVVCSDCGNSSIGVSVETQSVLAKLLGTSISKNELTDEEAYQVQKITGPLFQSHLHGQKLKALQFLGSLRRFQE
jgi:DNA repair protein RecO (recombination protein O)